MEAAGVITANVAGVNPVMVDHAITVFVGIGMESERAGQIEAATVSVIELITDGTRNALPGMARILGDARSFVPEVSAMIESHLRRIARSTAVPAMASEDFARILDHVPGCFVFLGNGTASKPLHNHGYDFDDRGLIHGARFHAAMARHRLPPA
jgi:hippurate hydrolase